MGKSDAALVRYLDDPVRYADLLNGYRFGGCQIIKPEDITERDTRLSGQSKRSNSVTHQKQRDLARKVVCGAGIAVIALENQDKIHYGMPVRTMVEDSLEYDRQLRAIQLAHKRNNDLKSPAEYLGGFSSHDTILPSATIILYFGKDDWDGPRDLLDLMNLDNLPEEIRELINGYPLHILEVRKFDKIENFQTDLQEVFGFIQKSDNKHDLKKYTEAHRSQFETLNEDAYDVIASITGNTMLLKKKEMYREGDSMNLCKGMADWAEEERKEGEFAKAKTIAQNAFSMGLDINKVSELCEERLDLIQTWFSEWNQSASATTK